MPELVWVKLGQPDRSGRDTERLPEGADAEGLCGADAGEHEVVRLPACDVPHELDGERPGDRHISALMCLGSPPDQSLAGDRRHGLGDDRPVASKVHSVDPERRHLSEPGAGVGQEQHDQPVHLIGPGVVSGVLARVGWEPRGVGEVLDLLVGQVEMFVLEDAGEVHTLRDVAGEPSVLHGEVEDQAEDSVDLVDGRRGLLLGQPAHPRLDVGMRRVGELDRAPLRPDVLAEDAGVALVRRGLDVCLSSEPAVSPVTDGHLGEGWVDEGTGDLRVLDRREEPFRVELAAECLVPLRPSGRAIVRPPRRLTAADTLLDAGHDLLSPEVLAQ
ncbi:MAG: hypothetical protein ABIO16_05400 [Nocardioides sp.]